MEIREHKKSLLPFFFCFMYHTLHYKKQIALVGWLGWLECQAVQQKVAGSILVMVHT